MTNQPHREFIYRMAFLVGRHIWDMKRRRPSPPWTGLLLKAQVSPSESGLRRRRAVALMAAALDDRITATAVSGYFAPREGLWKQPLDRNVFGLLKDFGDASWPRWWPTAPDRLTPPRARPGMGPRKRSKRTEPPGRACATSRAEIEREVSRARALRKDARFVLARTL